MQSPRILKQVRVSRDRSVHADHAVLRGEGVNPNPEPLPFRKIGRPLPFEDIANTPGVTEMALYAWLTSSHPTMPDIELGKDDLTNVVAYILSLRKTQP